jgi:hypothetical protein
MRFVNTIKFSPVAAGLDLPDKDDMFHLNPEDVDKDTLSKCITDESWWERQQKYCTEGYIVEDAIEKGGDMFIDGIDCIWEGNDCYLPNYDLWIYNRTIIIPPRLYFYLNFWRMKALVKNKMFGNAKQLTYPKFLDIDFLFARRLQMMEEQSKDNQDSKARQKGESNKVAGMIAGWNYTFVPAAQTIIVGYTLTDAENTFNMTKDGLDYLKNTQFYKDRSKGGDNKELIQSQNTKSEVRCITAKDNPQCMSRYSPYWIIYEEIGKGKKNWSISTAGFVEPSIWNEGVKTGFQFFLGTGGEMSDGVYDMEQRHYNPEQYNILSFKNKWDKEESSRRVGHVIRDLEYKIIDSEGNSLIGASMIEWQKEYEKKKTHEEKYRYRTQHPLFATDIFLITGGGYFGESITQKLNERIAYVNLNKASQVESRGWLRWKDIKNKYNGVVWEADIAGPFYIYEHPYKVDGIIPEGLYLQGTDSYDQDEAYYTNSMGASYIRKTFYNALQSSSKYVARVVSRPTVEEGGAETFFEYSALLSVYFGCRNLIEHSKLRIFDWYKRNNLSAFVMPRPEFAMANMVDNSKSSNWWGIDPATKPYWLSILRDRLTDDFISKMDDVEQMKAYAKFKYNPKEAKYNCDITIATAICEVLVLEVEEELIAKKDKKVRFSYYVQDRNGNFKVAYK